MNKTKLILLAILLFSFLSRAIRLSIPPTYYFDEVYHAFTAKAYADNDPRGYEWWHVSPEKGTAYEWLHPPISKLIMAAGIKIFGKNSFGWRIGSAIFGTLTIFLIYLLAQSLFNQPSVSLLAAFLASLDGLLLVQSRIAMNDIYVTTFILAALLFYWRWRSSKAWPWQRPGLKPYNVDLILSGICTGLAIATKWSGIFLLGIIGFMELINFLRIGWKNWKKNLFLLLTAYFLLPTAVYLLSFTQFFLQGHTWAQFKELHNQIIRYETGLKATHPYQSRAWQWPLLLRPIWYHVEYGKTTIANIYALANPFISWFSLIAIIWLIYQLLTTKNKKFITHYFLLITSYFLVWFPWLLSPRIMFYYHYTPAIPFLTIALALALTKLIKQKGLGQSLSIVAICLVIFAFIFFFPIWTGINLPQTWVKYFFWLPTWK